MKLDAKTGKLIPSEKDVRKQIRAYLKAMGIKFWWNFQGVLCYPGLPDLEGVHKKKHFYIEVKRPAGKLSQRQKDFKKMVEYEGELFIEAHTFEEFLKVWEKEV